MKSRFFRDERLKFDIGLLKEAVEEVDSRSKRVSPLGDHDVQGVLLTQVPGDEDSRAGGNVHGLYWTKNSEGKEVKRNEHIDEQKYTQFVSEFEDTYFKQVVDDLREFYTIGRVRLLWKHPRTCLSYHRDPEPRLHIAIVSNPCSHMVIDGESRQIPVDGHAWITDTKKYHTAWNGGEETRIHLVATLPGFGE